MATRIVQIFIITALHHIVLYSCQRVQEFRRLRIAFLIFYRRKSSSGLFLAETNKCKQEHVIGPVASLHVGFVLRAS